MSSSTSTTKRLAAILLALGAGAMLLTGCDQVNPDSSYDTKRGEREIDTIDIAAGISEYFIELEDGRTLHCIALGRGISCDWDGAK